MIIKIKMSIINITEEGDILLGELSLRDLEEKLIEINKLVKEVNILKKEVCKLKNIKENQTNDYEKHTE